MFGGVVAGVLLVDNALGIPFPPGLRLHAIGVTLALFSTGTAFLLSSKVVLEQGR
jgi:hypothetical protein